MENSTVETPQRSQGSAFWDGCPETAVGTAYVGERPWVAFPPDFPAVGELSCLVCVVTHPHEEQVLGANMNGVPSCLMNE